MVLNCKGIDNGTNYSFEVRNLERISEIYNVPPNANISSDMWLAQVADGSKGVEVTAIDEEGKASRLLFMYDYNWNLCYFRGNRRDVQTIAVDGSKDFNLQITDDYLRFHCTSGNFSGNRANVTLHGWKYWFEYDGGVIDLLDVYGEGRIEDGKYNPPAVSGFRQAFNINKWDQRVSNGPNKGDPIPKLLPIEEYANPKFPIGDGKVRFMTAMGTQLVDNTAIEMYRVLNKLNGVVILYNLDGSSIAAFERNNGNLVIKPNANLFVPFNEPTQDFFPVRVYGFPGVTVPIQL